MRIPISSVLCEKGIESMIDHEFDLISWLLSSSFRKSRLDDHDVKYFYPVGKPSLPHNLRQRRRRLSASSVVCASETESKSHTNRHTDRCSEHCHDNVLRKIQLQARTTTVLLKKTDHQNFGQFQLVLTAFSYRAQYWVLKHGFVAFPVIIFV